MFTKVLKYGVFALMLSCGSFVAAEEGRGQAGGRSDGYTFQDGKVMIWKDGNLAPMPADTTFADGSRLTRDGTWIASDGTRRKLNPNQRLTSEGKAISSEQTPRVNTDSK